MKTAVQILSVGLFIYLVFALYGGGFNTTEWPSMSRLAAGYLTCASCAFIIVLNYLNKK